MISPTLDSIRTFIHLVAVMIWVGGQIVLAALVPKVRGVAPQAMTTMARGFASVAWPAMIVIVFSGVWGLADTDFTNRSSQYIVTFGLKMLLVAATIIATIIHSAGTTKMAKALGGAVGLLASVFAAYAGVLMSHVG